jgi:predicted SnoaL-like aldol condensation-catalyzing enzyme
MTAKDLVVQATEELLVKSDVAAVEHYWAAGYVEHSTMASGGIDGLRDLARALPSEFHHEKVRVLGDDELVVIHGLLHGLGDQPTVAFDLWRVVDDKIVEHWDAHQPYVARNPSGHSMIDGPSEVAQPEKTAASKGVVQGFVELIMMGADRSQLPRFFDGDHFLQHNPVIADGVSGLGEAIQTGVWAAVVERCLRTLADGEFVFTQSEGTLHGEATAFYDLFRVDRDKLVEHWDVVFTKPDSLPHDNGLF